MEYSYLIDGLKRVGVFLIQNIREVSQCSRDIEVQGAQLMRTQGQDPEDRFYSSSLLFVGLVVRAPRQSVQSSAAQRVHCGQTAPGSLRRNTGTAEFDSPGDAAGHLPSDAAAECRLLYFNR